MFQMPRRWLCQGCYLPMELQALGQKPPSLVGEMSFESYPKGIYFVPYKYPRLLVAEISLYGYPADSCSKVRQQDLS